VTIHQDARLYASMLDGSETAAHALLPGRKAYVHVARGSVAMNDMALSAGDAAMLRDESEICLTHGRAAEELLFDLP
jgi:redox-sensitive bicupin YhaK (pirin superfamily)